MEPSSSATVRSARGLAGLPSLATTYTSSTIRPDALQTKGSVPTPSTLRVACDGAPPGRCQHDDTPQFYDCKDSTCAENSGLARSISTLGMSSYE
ncbi:unnamed protein product [Zymoseptoria tritici ST99CH_3D7]|uniref:Uncharacterized protein n=1 Tax=Zymoseptoria tritici (strain ST99CH_3D7) TaxID=1276538 RepID=A0A1X7RU02_ZYMT9|nr:unnamed protein product [Zymoseptoria tritici ST99CH_3D7]